VRPSSLRLLGVAAILASALGIGLYLAAPKPSDADQIAQQMGSIQSAARLRSTSGLMDVVSADYHDDAFCNNVDQLRILLLHGIRNTQSLDTDVDRGTIAVAGNTATSKVRVNGTDQTGSAFQQDVILHWQKEPSHRLLIFPDTTWQVVSAEYRAAAGSD
jgi:hypothetical protein